MSYQSRTTTKVLDGVALTSSWVASTTLAYSSAIPPVTAILTAEIGAAVTTAKIAVEGREVIAGQGTNDNWVQIKYMESKALGTGVPGTDGIVDGSQTTFHAEFPAYPEMRVKITHATATDAVTAWITA